jgi:ornithine--oxo-acid transaminase
MACAVSIEAIKVLEEEGMIENSRVQGERLLNGLRQIKHPKVKAVRGRGLWCAMDFVAEGGKEVAWNYCLKLKDNGLLAKPTHSTTIR